MNERILNDTLVEGKPVDLTRRKPFPAMYNIPAARADLSIALKRSNGVTQYNLFYHEEYRNHAEAARHVASCENVKLWPQPGEQYNVVQTLFDRALLSAVMAPHKST
jgi:hypothetical protein